MASFANTIKQIVSKHSKVSNAVNELQQQLPFFNDETCYNMIIDAAKHNKLQLIDDHNEVNSNDDDNDINKETEDILSSFTNDEIKEYQHPMLTPNNEQNISPKC